MIASNGPDVLDALYKSIRRDFEKCSTAGLEVQRAIMERFHEPATEPTQVSYEEVHCPGSQRAAIWCKPQAAKGSHVVLYLHGGAGFGGSPSSHRKLAAHLAKAAGSYVLVTDYRLVPEHPFPSALDDGVAAYQWLLEQGWSSSKIAVAGDSAGGNLAVTTTMKLKKLGIALPAAVAVFSPWLDMESIGESLTFNVKKEILSNPENVKLMSAQYRGDKVSSTDPSANPLYADFQGFPPLNISAGGFEILLSDSERLADRARSAGVETRLKISPGMQHVYHFGAGNVPEADSTIKDVGEWLSGKLNMPRVLGRARNVV